MIEGDLRFSDWLIQTNPRYDCAFDEGRIRKELM